MTDIVKRLREPPFGTETSERNLMNAAADEITSLIIDLEHAYGEVAFQTDKVTIHGEAVTRLTAENERLRAALEFYGKPENWEGVWDHQFRMMVQEPALFDRGKTARAALEGK